MRKHVVVALAAFAVATAAGSRDAGKLDPHTTELLAAIKGKENRPAGEVFRNVQFLKDVPAARFLRMMDAGYTRSLGVTCEHCHVEDRWDADDLRPKRAAREMAVMTREINARLLKMENLDDEESTVNCTTCHRGNIKPATELK
jgi:hypothetical protein